MNTTVYLNMFPIIPIIGKTINFILSYPIRTSMAMQWFVTYNSLLMSIYRNFKNQAE